MSNHIEKRFVNRSYRSSKLVKERADKAKANADKRTKKAEERAKLDSQQPVVPAFSPEFIEEISDAGAHDTGS
ncbi:hypothetical protein LCGC14_0622310 [marine sediment metagenome]|uniref:Uncharacterized protein n=1 Tax=marine sediment metagenome TaxID=412755 RepID=A0A0F9R4I6_9ZZZZ